MKEKNNKLTESSKKIQAMSKGAFGTVATKSRAIYKSSPKIILGIAALLLFGGGYAYFKKSESKKETYQVARGALTEAVSVTGKIKASTDADLSFEKGGTVSAVYVKEGDVVRAGQTLAVLSGGVDYGQVLQARAGVNSALAQLALVKAGTRQEESAVGQASVASAQTELSNIYATVDDSIKSSYTNAADAIRYKTQNFFSGNAKVGYTLNVPPTCNSVLENQVIEQRRQVELNLNAWSTLSGGQDTAARETALVEAQNYLNNVQSLLETMSSIVNAPCVSGDTRFDMYRVAISNARVSLTQAQSDLTLKKNAIASAKSGIDKAQTGLSLTNAPVQPEKIRVQEAALRSAYAALYSAQAAASKNVVTAPGSGTITRVDITAGEYANPGKSIMRLVGNGGFTVEAEVTESDIARIVLDNDATIKIPAIDSKEEFSGKVVSIDPAEQSDSGNPLYKIVVDLTKNDPRIKSGMTADTTIVTNKLENILRIPTRFMTKIAGVVKVYVVTNEKTLENTERVIETGRKSTDGYIEVTKGLEEGEILVLPTLSK